MTKLIDVPISKLAQLGIEALPRGPLKTVSLPSGATLEPPCSLKWTNYQHSVSLGAFSYQVSGYAFAAKIGRYCSFGENVQIGRQDHPMTWASTSPAFYHAPPLFQVGRGFAEADRYHGHTPSPRSAPTRVKHTSIGHDVWIGHGALIKAGVRIEHGAVIAAHAVVTRDVPAFAVVAGNPAVIKKWRLPAELISPMLKCQWWRFAPWQLHACDVTNPARFVHQVMHLEANEAPYSCEMVEIASAKAA